MHLTTFFDEIFKFKKPSEFIELRFFNKEKIRTDQVWFSDSEHATKYVEKHHQDKNCFFGIHPRFEKGGKNQSVSESFSVLYVDLDFKDTTREEVEKKIREFKLSPSLQVFTGHGFQAYWLLTTPIVEWTVFQRELLRLIYYFQADDLHDKQRPYRVPTTFNVKRKPYNQCKIIASSKKRYSLETVSAALNRYGVPAIVKKNEVKAENVTLSSEILSLGFVRHDNHFRDGVCPKCGNSSLYIYDNNPKMAICSHTGNCNFSSSLEDIEGKIKKDKKKKDASFNKEVFINRIKNQPPSIKTGYSKLDAEYHFRAGTINLIAGRLGTGKSTVLYNLMLNSASLYPEENFLLFTYEIPKDLVYLRMLTIEYARLAKNTIEFKEMEEEIKTGGPRAQVAMKRFERLNNIFIYDDPDLPIDQLQEIVSETKNVGAIGIDYLECVKVKDKATEELRVSSISTGLKKFAIKTNSFPIWLLSQLNRSPKERKDQRPQEQDVRYSDKAMQDSAIAWGLYNPSMVKSPAPKTNPNGVEEDFEEIPDPITKLEIIGMKNRYGRKTREVMTFDQASGLITQTSLIKRLLPGDEGYE